MCLRLCCIDDLKVLYLVHIVWHLAFTKFSSTFLAITVTFSQPSFSFGERGEIAEPVIMFSNPSSFIISVYVETNDISATGVDTGKCSMFTDDNDYKTGVYNITIPVHVTLQHMNISVCNDILLEMDEQFSVTILSNSHPDNVTTGTPSQAIVTILDNNRENFKIVFTVTYVYNFSNHCIL